MKIFGALVACFILSGCMATSVWNVRDDFSQDQLVGNGMIIGSVTQSQSEDKGHQGGTASISGFTVYFENIETEQVSYFKSDPWLLGGMTKGEFKELDRGRGKVFAIQLPPGKYKYDWWHATQGAYTQLNPVNPKVFEFEVIEGQATYIGNLDFELVFGQNVFGMGILVEAIQSVQDQYERDMVKVVKKFPLLDPMAIEKAIAVEVKSDEVQEQQVNKESQPIPILVGS